MAKTPDALAFRPPPQTEPLFDFDWDDPFGPRVVIGALLAFVGIAIYALLRWISG